MNINKGSMIATAIAILEEHGSELPFPELWEKVKEALEITPEEEHDRIGYFYADLSLSGDLVVLENNAWDLSKRHDFKAKTDTTDIYTDINEDSGDEEEKLEEKEYDDRTQGKVATEEEEEGELRREEEEFLGE